MIWLVVELILQVKKNYFAGGPSVHKNEEIVEHFHIFRKSWTSAFRVSYWIHGNVIFDILECHAFQKYV